MGQSPKAQKGHIQTLQPPQSTPMQSTLLGLLDAERSGRLQGCVIIYKDSDKEKSDYYYEGSREGCLFQIETIRQSLMLRAVLDDEDFVFPDEQVFEREGEETDDL